MSFKLQDQNKTGVEYVAATGNDWNGTIEENHSILQVSASSKGGKKAIATFNTTIFRRWTISWRLTSQSDADNLIAFWSDPIVLFMEFPIVFTPDTGSATEFIVRKTTNSQRVAEERGEIFRGSITIEEVL